MRTRIVYNEHTYTCVYDPIDIHVYMHIQLFTELHKHGQKHRHKHRHMLFETYMYILLNVCVHTERNGAVPPPPAMSRREEKNYLDIILPSTSGVMGGRKRHFGGRKTCRGGQKDNIWGVRKTGQLQKATSGRIGVQKTTIGAEKLGALWICTCIYIYTYVCMYIYMYICMYVIRKCISKSRRTRLSWSQMDMEISEFPGKLHVMVSRHAFCASWRRGTLRKYLYTARGWRRR